MSVVHIQLPFEALLKAVEQLSLPELEKLTAQVLSLRAQQKAPCLSITETELMLKINQGLPPERQTRFDELVHKRQEEILTPSEHQELLAFTHEIEKADEERISCLAELAAIRGVPLDVLMDSLEIPPPS